MRLDRAGTAHGVRHARTMSVRPTMTFLRTALPTFSSIWPETDANFSAVDRAAERGPFCGGPVGVVQGGADGRAAPLAVGAARTVL